MEYFTDMWIVDKPAIYLIHYYLGCVPMEKDKKMATSIPKHVDWFDITIWEAFTYTSWQLYKYETFGFHYDSQI